MENTVIKESYKAVKAKTKVTYNKVPKVSLKCTLPSIKLSAVPEEQLGGLLFKFPEDVYISANGGVLKVDTGYQADITKGYYCYQNKVMRNPYITLTDLFVSGKQQVVVTLINSGRIPLRYFAGQELMLLTTHQLTGLAFKVDNSKSEVI